MRKFAAVCLLLMCLVCGAILFSAWYSYNSGKNLEATDDIVNGMAEHSTQHTATDYMPHVSEEMEPVGFTLAGVVAGLIVGYLWEEISELGRAENVQELSNKNDRSGR